MKIRRFLAGGILGLLATAGVAAAAIPGPQRALMPQFFGLVEIAPGVFTDDVSKKEQWLSIIAAAEPRDRDFYGTLLTRPRYILCSTLSCEHVFGKHGAIGQTIGWSLIHIPPKALLNPSVGIILMAHERSHAELHYRWGWTALWDGKIPTWFDEGLATHVSGDYRVRSFYGDFPSFSAADRKWVQQAKYFWQWSGTVGERGWHTAYGAAAENVELLEQHLGKEGLKRLIDQALAGKGFEAAVNSAAPGAI